MIIFIIIIIIMIIIIIITFNCLAQLHIMSWSKCYKAGY